MGGGSGICVRDDLPLSHIIDYDNDEFETIWVNVKTKRAVTICSNYLPPKTPADKLGPFLDCLPDCVVLAQEHMPTAIIITGTKMRVTAGFQPIPTPLTCHFFRT